MLRAPTTGAKGSAASAVGVRELLARAARRAGEPVHTVLLAEIEPVETALVELGRLEELDLARNAVARPASSTPSGEGAGAGRLRRLDALGGPPDGPAIAVVLDEDFDEAAAALVAARARGWQVVGAVVRGDDAVLIGNRFDRALPIVDEVDDAAALPEGALAAVEVAAAGATVTALSDPLRLAALLDLGTAGGPGCASRRAGRRRRAGGDRGARSRRARAGRRAECRRERADRVRRRHGRGARAVDAAGAARAGRRTAGRRRQPRRRARRVLVRSARAAHGSRPSGAGSCAAARSPSHCSRDGVRRTCTPRSPESPRAASRWCARSGGPPCSAPRPRRVPAPRRSSPTSAAARSTCTATAARSPARVPASS